jgi:acyl-CoA synthetase (AMP-forming)/AMP-acid ligase II
VGAAPLTPSWHAEATPDVPAIVLGSTGETVTYAQLEDRSTRLARALAARGLSEGDTVAICMENNRQYLEAAWAAQRSGLRYTAVNSHLRPAEVQYVLDDSGAVALVSSAAMADVVTPRGIGARTEAERTVYLCPAPLYHSAPLVWSMSLQRGPHRRGGRARAARGRARPGVLRGRAPVQLPQPAAGAELATELLAACRAELASYKCPRSVDFTDELPREPNGKLYKRRLRERYWAGHESLII